MSETINLILDFRGLMLRVQIFMLGAYGLMLRIRSIV